MIASKQLQSWFTALLNDTQDVHTWLVFSDWLEEQDHSQAEVTRLWAIERWLAEQWTPEHQERLQALLTAGLRPCLPRYINSLGMELVLVPRGTFWMSQFKKNAQKQVTIEHDFYMGIYPVTQGQWQDLMGNNPSWFSRTGGGKDKVQKFSDAELRKFPVEQVYWGVAQEFVTQLNAQENAEGEWLYRLPTEAEWEYTCREGATSKEACSFDFYLDTRSNSLSSQQANFKGIRPFGKDKFKDIQPLGKGKAPQGPYLRRTTVVGSYKPNRLGIYDMHGNVCECCDDWYLVGSCRVFRGGSWKDPGGTCRAAIREGITAAGGPNNVMGFRLSLVPSEK